MAILGKILFYLASVQEKCTKNIKIRLGRSALWIKTLIVLGFLGAYCFALYSYSQSEGNGFQAEIDFAVALSCWNTVIYLFYDFGQLCMMELLQLVLQFGWKRLCVYISSLFLFAYFFVTVPLDQFFIRSSEILTDAYLSRFENNTLTVYENRAYFEKIELYPFTNDPKIIFRGVPMEYRRLNRYVMEDAKFTCTVLSLGFPGGRPLNPHVAWRLDGVPLTFTDRHFHLVKFKELPRSDCRYSKYNAHMDFLSLYEVKSTLKIFLLQDDDFGSYTCHAPDKVTLWLPQESAHPPTPKAAEPRSPPPPSPQPQPWCQCSHMPDRRRVIQDSISHKHAFRLIRMNASLEQIIAPPSSILFFHTSYMHLSTSSDVQMDYTVNGLSFQDLCASASNGCSALQRLLAGLIDDSHRSWKILWSLPLLLRNRNHQAYGEEFSSGHCLCENSFGRHSVTYLRRYYNRTSKQFQLFEIPHPQTLLLRPPDQKSCYNFFHNFLNFDPIRRLSLEEYLPESAYDLLLLKDFAVVLVTVLEFSDIILFLLMCVGFIFISYMIVVSLEAYGRFAKRLCCYGSMSYLSTAVMAHDSLSLQETRHEPAENFYDIYLCYSDTVLNIITETVLPLLEQKLRLRVFFRERDIPPNAIELQGIEEAINNSNFFIIFLSDELLQDPQGATESNCIIGTNWDRGSMSKDILVIKLSNMETPVTWCEHEIHDWTASNLSRDDQLLRLLRWYKSRRGDLALTDRSLVLDGALTILPFGCVFVMLLITL